MSSSMVPQCSSTVFETCGVKIHLNSRDLPVSTTINNSVPQDFKMLAKQRNGPTECDFTIIFGEKEYFVHKEVLITQIQYFRALFDSNMAECTHAEIDLTYSGLEISALENILNYAYTGHLTITEENVLELMIGADFLQFESVTDECGEYLRRQCDRRRQFLNIENILPFAIFCKAISYTKIDSYLHAFIDMNFVPISHTEDFLEMSIDDLVMFAKKGSLRIDEEKQVFEAIDRWIQHQPARKLYSARLLKCVRFTQLSDTFIRDVVGKCSWVTSNTECMTLLNQATVGIRNGAVIEDSLERVCDGAPRLIFSFRDTRSSRGIHLATLEVYNPFSDSWTQGGSYEVPHHLTPIAVIGHKIFFFGSRKRVPVATGQVYDTITNEWESVPNIPGHIGSVSSDVIDGKIYVVGGINEEGNGLSSLLSYDPATKEWMSFCEMERPRAGSAVCHLNGKLYAIGGVDNQGVRSHSECYNPKTNRWTPIAPMISARSGASAAVHNGQIYVVGGCYLHSNAETGMDALSDGEKYDPTSDSWTPIGRMNHGRAFCKLVASCGKLFVIGGIEGIADQQHDSTAFERSSFSRFELYRDVKTTKPVEMYDDLKNEWVERAPMIDSLSKICVFTIPSTTPTPVFALDEASSPVPILDLNMNLDTIEKEFEKLSEEEHSFISKAVEGGVLTWQSESSDERTRVITLSTVQQVNPVDNGVTALVLCETPERALAITWEYQRLVEKYSPEIKVCSLTEESRLVENRRTLQIDCPNIVVGTASRIYRLIATGVLNLKYMKHFVIEGTEQMLDDIENRMSIERIVESASHSTQTMLVTSTIPEESLADYRDIFKNHAS